MGHVGHVRPLSPAFDFIYEDGQWRYDRDKYDRLLRYVWFNGQDVNLEMIAEGYGNEYTYNKPYKYQVEFRAAEQQAKAAGLNLWSPTGCNGQR